MAKKQGFIDIAEDVTYQETILKGSKTSVYYRKKFLRRQLQYDRRYHELFGKLGDEFAKLASDPLAKFSSSFRFHPSIEKKIAVIMDDFAGRLNAFGENEITQVWKLSTSKNDEVVKDYLSTMGKIKAAQSAKYFNPNIPALKAFIKGNKQTPGFSDAVWKIAGQAREEMSIHLGLGIMNGDSNQVISRRIRKYLNDPDAYFRRVRDKFGKLVASKAMRANRPGRGVYNSAFKNAARVTRTETNRAYLTADHERWMQLDMVMGVKISLSGSHPAYSFPEICETNQGIYPKWFNWAGWHPQCLCHAVPIMVPQQDFLAYLRSDKPLESKQIKVYPESFKKYLTDNKEKVQKSTAYWIRDNKRIINGILKKAEK